MQNFRLDLVVQYQYMYDELHKYADFIEGRHSKILYIYINRYQENCCSAWIFR